LTSTTTASPASSPSFSITPGLVVVVGVVALVLALTDVTMGGVARAFQRVCSCRPSSPSPRQWLSVVDLVVSSCGLLALTCAHALSRRR
jgi:hypothetical protein